MTYYVRKIARSKWPQEILSDNTEKAQLQINSVSADAITNCIKTTQNKLSLWKVEERTDTIEDIIPLLVGFDKPDTCDIIYISEEDLKAEGLILEQSSEDANVRIEELKCRHYNAIVNNYEGLGKFSKVVLKSLNNHKRYTSSVVKKKLKSMLNNNEINREVVSEELFSKICS